MRIGAWQFDIRRCDVAANVEAALRGVEAAAAEGVQLLVLPEMWPTSFLSAGAEGAATRDALERAVDASVAAVERVAVRAGELGLAVAGSAYGHGAPGELPRNRFSLWSEGRSRATYDKVHLFSVTAEQFGFSAGDQPPEAAPVGPATVAGLICYDLRFAPVVEAARRTGADVIVVPAQWPTPRASHWHALLAGRAVEAQAFVVGANRVGREALGRRGRELVFGGDSAIVGPDGTVRARSEGPGEALVAAEIDPAEAVELRRAVRVAEDRRPTLYSGWFPGAGPNRSR